MADWYVGDLATSAIGEYGIFDTAEDTHPYVHRLRNRYGDPDLPQKGIAKGRYVTRSRPSAADNYGRRSNCEQYSGPWMHSIY